jgi:hypothetical protein
MLNYIFEENEISYVNLQNTELQLVIVKEIIKNC